MDPAVIVNYALAYIAWVILVFLLFLPTILSFVLLLLLAAAVQSVVLLLKAAAVGIYRGLATLFRNIAGRFPHRRGGGGLVPH